MTTYIKGFKIKGSEEVYKLEDTQSALTAEHALSADSATYAGTAGSVDAIGNVEKYSGLYGGKQREGLKFMNGVNEALIELNSKGNFSVESLTKHVNIESAQGVQIKPTTTIILDSSRRILSNKGNEINLEAKFDDFGDSEYNGYDGYDEQWAEFKIKSRNLDLRCNGHGGIALQIAGKDSGHHENKIKFESDRVNNIGATGSYCGEGGKGLEFGTFNNEHASLFCGDYRFKGDADVYGVTRGALELNSKGKTDYPTQTDDFKDILDPTNKATWNEIIDAAKKCRNLEETITDAVNGAVISGVDMSIYVTNTEVQDVVDEAIANAHIDTTGLATETWVLDQNYISNLPEPVQYLKIGKSKGNFAVDVTGKYTWEATNPKDTTMQDEYGNVVIKGDRVTNYTNESFYSNENKVYYKASVETVFADGAVAPEGTIVYNPACDINIDAVSSYTIVAMGDGETSYYEDETNFVYKGTKNVSIAYGETTPIKKKTLKEPKKLSAEEIAYYESQVPVYDEEGNLIAGWEKVPVWAKNTLWTMNEININLETDSKIKFAGKKIETVWTIDDVDYKMDDILLSTNTLSTDANEVVFEQKISKNGDRSGQDTELVYTFGNNVADPEKVADFAAFKANYNGKHTPKTDDELRAMYDAFLAEGESFEIRVKVSELLGLVSKVAALEETISSLTARIEALEGTTPEPEPEPEPQTSATRYSFTSYADSGCTQQYGTGIAEVVSTTESSTTITVISNTPDESFNGHQFVVNETVLVEGHAMQLFETDGTPVAIWVVCTLLS